MKTRASRAIATIAIGSHQDLLNLSIGNFLKFAEIHDYQPEICYQSLDAAKPPAWTKLLFILNLMEKYDEIFWVDSDAIILDTSVDVLDEIDPSSEMAWVYHEYENQRHPNSGVMYIRVNESTRNLFSEASLQYDLEKHPWWDQAALMRVMGIHTEDSEIKSGTNRNTIKIKEQELSLSWNSIRQNSASRPHIRHFAGEPFWIRKFLMAEYVNPGLNASAVLQDMITEFLQLQSYQATIDLPVVSSQGKQEKISSKYTFLKLFKRIATGWSKIK